MSAPRALLRALVRIAAAVILIASLSWLLAEAAPGSPAERAARAAGVLPPDDSDMDPATRADILAQVAADHDLDQPLISRIAGQVIGLLSGDLGHSWRDRTPVRRRVWRAAGPTALLILCALFCAILAGMTGAVLAARRPGSALDLALSAAAAAAFAVPPVWLGLFLLSLFADGQPFRILPGAGLGSASALILPVSALAVVPAFVIARHARAALLAAMGSPWAVAARARGASPRRILAVHASRAALPELTPLLAVLLAYLFGAALVVERVFDIRGLGALLVSAAQHGDAPVVVGVAVIAGAVIAAASSLAGLVQGLADPRIAAQPASGDSALGRQSGEG